MKLFSKTDSHARNWAISLVAATALAACGGGETNTPSTPGGSSSGPAPVSNYEVAGDHAVGNPDAPITVVEYASVVCGACANWHNSVYPEFKEKYVDSGQVRYIFREFPTAPERLAFAGFTIANCAGEDKFLSNISIQFKRQQALLGAPDRRAAYENLAKASGISVEKYEACLADPEWKARYDAIVQGGIDAGVTGTPSFFINGTKYKAFTVEDFDEILSPLLTGGLKEMTPEDAPKEDMQKEAAE